MSKYNVGVSAIYNGGLTPGYSVQSGGNAGRKIVKGLDTAAKTVGFFRNVIKPIADRFGIKSPGLENLVNKGYGKRKRKYKK